MALTLAQALQDLPILATAQVVAGHNGLDRSILWTHIVDHTEVVQWLREGDLLITTAFALKDRKNRKTSLIAELGQKGVAGILISVGRYVHEIPAQMVEAANKDNFPIISIPWEVPLVEVTHAIHERIINEQYALNEQAFRIHKVLTQLVLQGGTLETLASTLADLLQRSITIEDTALRLLAHKSFEPLDQVRKRSIQDGVTPDEVFNYFTSINLFDQLKEDPRPHRVPAAPEIGLDLERIIAPILVGSELFGYIWIIATDRVLTDLDFLAIERGASVAALMINREKAIYEAEQRVKVRFLESLMDPYATQDLDSLAESMHRFGLKGGYLLLVVEDLVPAGKPLSQLGNLISAVASSMELSVMDVEWGQRVIILISSVPPAGAKEFAEKLVEAGRHQGFCLVVGLSTISTQASELRKCYQQAMDSLRVGTYLGGGKPGLWSFEKLGVFLCLLKMPPETRAMNQYITLIRTMDHYDREHGTDYLKSLECFLDHSKNIQKTAQVLYVHRNTLSQRISKIQDMWDLDLDDPYMALNLQVAIKDFHLNPDE